MDQIKKLLAGAQKNIFWIVSALTILLGVVGYWMSRSAMDKTFQEQSTAIDSQYSALSTISSEVATHPNAKSHVEMDKQIGALMEDVQTAWVKQYERQAEILKWPADKIPAKFIAKVEKLRPIELALEYPLTPAADPLVTGDKMQYAKYINEQFPELARIIGTEWVGTPPVAAAGNAMGGYGGYGSTDTGMSGMTSDYGGGSYGGDMGGMMGGSMMSGMSGMPGSMLLDRKPDLVVWPKSVQDAVIADVQTWRSKYPTTHDILYTQENIWILKGLLEIIGKVNAKADAVANFQATVKAIEFLRIGRSAVGKVGVIDRPGMGMGMGMGADGSMDPYGGDMSMGMGEGSSSMDTGSMTTEDIYGSSGMGGEGGGEEGMGGLVVATPDPANGRYVDAAYAPLTGDDLRTKMKSAAPEDAYFAVAKRVPVRMRLKVDQRRIQTLIAECGNADLLFEIRQIRIGDTTPAPAASASGGYGMDPYGGSGGSGGMSGDGAGYSGDTAMSDPSMMGGSGSGMDGGYGGSMDPYGGSGMGMGMGPGAGSSAKVWDMPVEIYGVVYLFNPPDLARLGLNKVTAETEVADKVEVSADVVQAEAAAAAEAAPPATEAADAAAAEENGPGAPAAGAPQPGANGQPGRVPNPAGNNAGGGAAAGNPGARPGAAGAGAAGAGAAGTGPQPGAAVPPGGVAPGANAPAGNAPAGNPPAGNVPGAGAGAAGADNGGAAATNP